MLQEISPSHLTYMYAPRDFAITPSINGFESIFVAVNQPTKITHFFPCSKNVIGEDLVDLLIKNLVLLHDFKFLEPFVKYPRNHNETLISTHRWLERGNQILEKYLGIYYKLLIGKLEFNFSHSVNSCTTIANIRLLGRVHPMEVMVLSSF